MFVLFIWVIFLSLCFDFICLTVVSFLFGASLSFWWFCLGKVNLKYGRLIVVLYHLWSRRDQSLRCFWEIVWWFCCISCQTSARGDVSIVSNTVWCKAAPETDAEGSHGQLEDFRSRESSTCQTPSSTFEFPKRCLKTRASPKALVKRG